VLVAIEGTGSYEANLARTLQTEGMAIDTRRTADRNMLTALLHSFDLGIDARKPLTDAQVRSVAAWRARRGEDTALQTIREEARRLAVSVLERTRQMEANHAALAKHVDELAPGLTDAHGVGPVTAASVLVAYSHRGRVRSDAAFAALHPPAELLRMPERPQ
jgi:transposase